MNTEKAEKEMKIIKSLAPTLHYAFDGSAKNKVNLPIEKEGFRLVDIVSKLKENESLIFAINDGMGINPNSGKLEPDEKYAGSIFWNNIVGDYVRVSSSHGSMQEWKSKIEADSIALLEEIAKDDMFSTIVTDIKRINALEGKTIPEKFIKFNEEFGEFSAEVVKMLGMSHKPYDEEHLIEEAADAFQVILSTILSICERQHIDFTRILKTVLEKNKKWEAKIPEYKRSSKEL